MSPAAKTAEDQQLLEDVGALIAYAGALLGGGEGDRVQGSTAAGGMLCGVEWRILLWMPHIQSGPAQRGGAIPTHYISPSLSPLLPVHPLAELPKSPSARLLSPEHRAELATSVVRAFLQQAGKRELSALEIIHSQACICHSQLREFGDPCVSAVPDVDAFVRARGAPTTKIGQESDDDTDMISAPEERL